MRVETSKLPVLLPVQPFYLLFHVRKTGSAVMRWSRHKSSINSLLPLQTLDLISTLLFLPKCACEPPAPNLQYRALSGSSSINTFGSSRNAMESASFCFIPSEYFPTAFLSDGSEAEHLQYRANALIIRDFPIGRNDFQILFC